MPAKTDESPPRQHDRPAEVGQTAHDEVRSFDTDASEKSGNYDAGVRPIDDRDINTHGSER